jgi:hypothetical protein
VYIPAPIAPTRLLPSERSFVLFVSDEGAGGHAVIAESKSTIQTLIEIFRKIVTTSACTVPAVERLFELCKLVDSIALVIEKVLLPNWPPIIPAVPADAEIVYTTFTVMAVVMAEAADIAKVMPPNAAVGSSVNYLWGWSTGSTNVMWSCQN